MGKYAEGTTVSVGRSTAEIESICRKYGADGFSAGWGGNCAHIMFRMKDRYIRIEMPLAIYQKTKDKRGYLMGQDSVDKENRRRWRAMVLYVKAKFESVDSEIVSFEEAFLSHIVMPNRQTAGEFLIPQIAEAYKTGGMPKLLGGGGM